MTWTEWVSAHWQDVIIPLAAFLATYLIGLWLRAYLYRYFSRLRRWTQWKGSSAVEESLRRPFSDWLLILGAFIGTRISILSMQHKDLAGRILATLFVVSLTWVIVLLSGKLIKLYAPAARVAHRTTTIIINTLRVIIIVTGALVILSLWGAPISPVLLAIAVIVFIAGLALRDAIPSYFFSLQLAAEKHIKPGDFVRLDSGEAGEVASISWQNTHLKSLTGETVIIPNSKLARSTVTNYGRPARQATNPFHFNTRLHLRELTGLKACNLTELVTILKNVPDSVVYYHVHHFLEEHLYLTPEPANDFAIWVNTALNHNVLSEQLASIDTFSFPNIGNLKQVLVEEIENHLQHNPDDRQCQEGEEFHFIRSISFVVPTPYVAHDLREFIEILRKVTIDSVFFHVFESRLRLQKGSNDFSIWMSESVGERALGDKIAAIDPYAYTLENLRARIIGEVESYAR